MTDVVYNGDTYYQSWATGGFQLGYISNYDIYDGQLLPAKEINGVN